MGALWRKAGASVLALSVLLSGALLELAGVRPVPPASAEWVRRARAVSGPPPRWRDRPWPLWGDAARLSSALESSSGCVSALSVGVNADVVAWEGESRFDPVVHFSSETKVLWRDVASGSSAEAPAWAVVEWRGADGGVIVRKVELAEANCMVNRV